MLYSDDDVIDSKEEQIATEPLINILMDVLLHPIKLDTLMKLISTSIKSYKIPVSSSNYVIQFIHAVPF